MLLFSLGRINKKFQVIIEAVRSIANTGYVAVDDISFEDCELPPTNRSCSNREFRCERGSCVPQDRKCDIVDDCGDNSDERLAVCSSFLKSVILKFSV